MAELPPPPDFSKVTGGGTTTKKGGGGKATGGGAAAQHAANLASVYMSIWGVPPPPGYVQRAGGLNIFEFEMHERSKPAFRNSPRYQEERLALEFSLTRQFGGLGV